MLCSVSYNEYLVINQGVTSGDQPRGHHGESRWPNSHKVAICKGPWYTNSWEWRSPSTFQVVYQFWTWEYFGMFSSFRKQWQVMVSRDPPTKRKDPGGDCWVEGGIQRNKSQLGWCIFWLILGSQPPQKMVCAPEIQHRYQKWPYLKGVTFSKPSFWVSMLVFGGCIQLNLTQLEAFFRFQSAWFGPCEVRVPHVSTWRLKYPPWN